MKYLYILFTIKFKIIKIMNIDALTNGTQDKKNSFTIFSTNNDGSLAAARPVNMTFAPNNTNLTTVYSPQHISVILSAPKIALPTNYSTGDKYPLVTKKKHILNDCSTPSYSFFTPDSRCLAFILSPLTTATCARPTSSCYSRSTSLL